MATITQRIGLEGGQAVKKELEEIGAAGRKAFNDLFDAAKASGAISRVQSVFDGIKRKAAEVGTAFRNIGGAMDELGSRITSSAKTVGLVTAAVSGAVLGFALLVKGAADTSDALKVTADALGLNTKQLTEYQFAAEQSGVSADQFTRGLLKFNKALDESNKEELEFSKKQASLNRDLGRGKITIKQYTESLDDMRFQQSQNTNAFSRLGMEIVRNADGTNNLKDSFDNALDAFKEFPDGATKSALAMELFGAKNSKFVQFLNQGSEGLRKQTEEARRVAPALNKIAEAVNLQLNDAFDKLAAASGSARLAFLSVFSPLTLRVVDALTESIVNNRTQLITWASDIAQRIAPIVDDLIATIQGRDQDVKNPFFIQARDNIVAFGVAVQTAITGIVLPAFRGLMAVLNVVASAINTVFGTQFTGSAILVALVIAKIVGAFGILSGAVSVVVSIFTAAVTLFGGATVALTALGVVVGFLATRLALLAWPQLGVAAQNDFNMIATAATTLWNLLKALWTGGVPALMAEMAKLGPQIKAAVIDFITAEWQKFTDSVKVNIDIAVQRVKSVWEELGSWFANTVEVRFIASIARLIQKVLEWLGLLERAKSAQADVGSGSSPGAAEGRQFWRGGFVRGSGTSTSDSIWARISNGEFVTRAKAVRKYGTDFMHAINRGLLPVSAVRNMARGLNMGGLVERVSNVMPRIPSFADGGPVAAVAGGGGRSFTLNINGTSFPGLTAPIAVAAELEKYATKNQVRSAGRKPSWMT